jgi:hypothetical protein
MVRECVEHRESGFYFVGSRVPVDRIIQDYRNGEDPETIQAHYPTLTLEQVNGAIAFYQSHKKSSRQWRSAGALKTPTRRRTRIRLTSRRSSSACGGRPRRDEPNG